jgi:curved DNA-binding protein CbpA
MYQSIHQPELALSKCYWSALVNADLFWIVSAYQTLSDETERRQYDQLRSMPNAGGAGPGQQGPGGAGNNAWQRRAYQDVPVNDIFKTFFSSSQSSSPHGAKQGRQTFSSGDDDSQFENLFRHFSFNPSGQARGAGGPQGGM